MDQQTNQGQVLQNLLTDQQKKDLFEELGLSNISEERKEELGNQMVDNVLLRVFNRISQVLTDQDLATIEELDQKDDSGVTTNQFLSSKVPNLNEIVMEEAAKFKSETKNTLDSVRSQLPQ